MDIGDAIGTGIGLGVGVAVAGNVLDRFDHLGRIKKRRVRRRKKR